MGQTALLTQELAKGSLVRPFAQPLRRAQGWEGRRVVLWPEQAEPALHPFDGRPGDPTLPDRAREALLDWVALNPDAVLCVRPRAGDAPPPLPALRVMMLTTPATASEP